MHYEKILKYIQIGRDEGGTILTGHGVDRSGTETEGQTQRRKVRHRDGRSDTETEGQTQRQKVRHRDRRSDTETEG